MSNFTPAWFKKGFFNESLFCDDFLSSEHPPTALLEWRIFHPGRQNDGPHAPAV